MFPTFLWILLVFALNVFVLGQDSVNFLQSYGYIKPSNGNQMNLMSSLGYSRALIAMQRFAGLQETGVLDEATIDKMKQPRCSIPDVEANDFDEHKRPKRFAVYGSKWPKTLLTWSLVRESTKVPKGLILQELTKAFQVWAEGSNGVLSFQEVGKDRNADIKISFLRGDHGCGVNQAFDGPGMKLAHAFSPQKGDIHFDDDEDWNGTRDQGVSIFWTAVHEIGHSLGFRHTPDEKSIMFPYYQTHEGDFKLPNVDRDGVRYLYTSKIEPTTESTRTSKAPTVKVIKPEEPENPSFPCHTPIDAIANIRNEIFVFIGPNFWWIKENLEFVQKTPTEISQYFLGFPPEIKAVDAVYERRVDMKIVFFVGDQYYIYDANTYYRGPRPISDYGLFDLYGDPIKKVDAVFTWGHNGRSYIIARDAYATSLVWRLEPEEEKVEKTTYPMRLYTLWDDLPDPVHAAFTWSYNSSTYFFCYNKYWQLNNEKMQSYDDSPKNVHSFWFKEMNCPIKPQSLKSSDHSSRSVGSTMQLKFPIVIFILFFFILCF